MIPTHRILLLVSLALPLSAVACSGADASADPASEDDEVRSGGLTPQALPAGAFRTRVDELRQEWLDNNIMTGDAILDAGKLKGTLSDASLSKFAQKMANDRLRSRDEGTILAPTIKTPAFGDALVKSAAKKIGVDGYVYDPSNPENWESLEANIRELTGFLGAPSKLDVVTLEAKIKDADSDSDQVSLWIFVNRETKEFVAFYAREGTV